MKIEITEEELKHIKDKSFNGGCQLASTAISIKLFEMGYSEEKIREITVIPQSEIDIMKDLKNKSKKVELKLVHPVEEY